MVLFSLESRTPVRLALKEGSEIKAEFAENYDDKRFYVQCAAISDNISSFINDEITATIFFGEGFYTAKCRILGLGRKKGYYETVALEAAEGFEYVPQRTSQRINVAVAAEVYGYSANRDNFNKGGFICRASSRDISSDGIHLVSDYKIDLPKGSMFTVSFYFFSFTFIVPAKLMRSARGISNTYEYGFLFDFPEPELQDKLRSAILKERLSYDL